MATKVGMKERIFVHRLVGNAELPFKEHDDDIGWDLTLIGRQDNNTEDTTNEVNMYRTGLTVHPPKGYHVEIVARSSLHKSGYMLANSVGIIDPGYTGEIFVPLYKFREGEDLQLPTRAVQMILRKSNNAHIAESANTGPVTSRGAGGFGSTGGYNQAHQPRGGFIPNPTASGYQGDMGQYHQMTSSHSQGMTRPTAAPPRGGLY